MRGQVANPAARCDDSIPQAKLVANTQGRQTGNHAKEPSPLAGKLFDETGAPLTPSHAVKSGRRYRYYVSRHLVTGSEGTSRRYGHDGWRLPAREIERIVSDAITTLIGDRATLAQCLREAGVRPDQLPKMLTAVAGWKGESLGLVERAELACDQIAVAINLSPIVGGANLTIRRTVPKQLKRRGVEMRHALEDRVNGAASLKPDPALIKAVARAHKWFDELASGRTKSISAIAKAEGLSDRYVSRLLPLALLAPEIVETILAGRQPVDLTTETLTRYSDLPLNWTEQKALRPPVTSLSLTRTQSEVSGD